MFTEKIFQYLKFISCFRHVLIIELTYKLFKYILSFFYLLIPFFWHLSTYGTLFTAKLLDVHARLSNIIALLGNNQIKD